MNHIILAISHRMCSGVSKIEAEKLQLSFGTIYYDLELKRNAQMGFWIRKITGCIASSLTNHDLLIFIDKFLSLLSTILAGSDKCINGEKND